MNNNMTLEQVKKLKEKIKKYSNYREISKELGWNYQRMAQRLGGFQPLQKSDAKKIEKLLSKKMKKLLGEFVNA